MDPCSVSASFVMDQQELGRIYDFVASPNAQLLQSGNYPISRGTRDCIESSPTIFGNQ